ncbi:MAG: helix-turn-helix transcriptional regulator [Clostridia bacterium]|nr:helix-turn-helix transcriptional regulator [Clostridia bacterium]
MKIKSIEIKNIMGGYLKGNNENIRHIKSLPCLSVVQAMHGRYEIALGGSAAHITEEGGAFVAPAGISQNILHHNGVSGFMEAQWVFMNVTVNGFYALEDVFDLPLLLPADCREVLEVNIGRIREESSLCAQYAAAYELTELLISHAAMKDAPFDTAAAQLKRYIDEHYSEKITVENLAAAALCSVPGLYRIFRSSFQMSPHNYINKIRLEKASVLLEQDSRSVAEIAGEVGFDDPVYFSKLFKARYELSPKQYRAVNEGMKKSCCK